jgi:Sortase domain
MRDIRERYEMHVRARCGRRDMTYAAGWNRQYVIAFALVCLAALTCIGCNFAAKRPPAQRSAPAPDVPLQAPQAAVPKDQSNVAPMRLLIPRIGLSAGILALGPAANGAMQAPQRGGPDDPIWGEVYWWKVGTIPGQIGNAVIAGHVNRPDGSPSAFTYLDNLRVGDSIEIQTAGGQTLVFRVTEKATPSAYVRSSNDPTMGRIFGPALAPHLNLITCWGQWDGKEYNQRLVIYSTLVRATTTAPASSNRLHRQVQGAPQLPTDY